MDAATLNFPDNHFDLVMAAYIVEARTRLLYGLRAPESGETSRLDYQMVSCRGD